MKEPVQASTDSAGNPAKYTGITLTQERLRELVIYDPATGTFTRAVDSRSGEGNKIVKARKGDIAGWLDYLGYRRVCVDGRVYKAHRLAWLYVHGCWPDQLIDHINGCPSDNRIDNLRLASPSINMQNQRRGHLTGKSGLLGAQFVRGKWVSKINVNQTRKWLGTFDTAEQAHAAYITAKRLLHPGCTI